VVSQPRIIHAYRIQEYCFPLRNGDCTWQATTTTYAGYIRSFRIVLSAEYPCTFHASFHAHFRSPSLCFVMLLPPCRSARITPLVDHPSPFGLNGPPLTSPSHSPSSSPHGVSYCGESDDVRSAWFFVSLRSTKTMAADIPWHRTNASGASLQNWQTLTSGCALSSPLHALLLSHLPSALPSNEQRALTTTSLATTSSPDLCIRDMGRLLGQRACEAVACPCSTSAPVSAMTSERRRSASKMNGGRGTGFLRLLRRG
jgi:hypothetical protein